MILISFIATFFIVVSSLSANPLLDYITATSITQDRIDIGMSEFPLERFETCSNSFDHVGVSLNSSYNDYYRKGGMEKDNSSFARTNSLSLWLNKTGKINYRLGLGFKDDLQRISLFSDDHIQNSYLKNYRSSMSTHFVINNKNSYLLSKVDLINGEKSEFLFELRRDFKGLIKMAAFWENRLNEQQLSVIWNDQYANLDLRCSSENSGIWIESDFSKKYQIKAKIDRNVTIKKSLFTLDPTIQPWGDGIKYYSSITAKIGNYVCSAGGRGLYYEGMGYGYKGVLKFSKITNIYFTSDALFIGFSNGKRKDSKLKISTEFEYLRWTGKLRGHIQPWPWTSGWLDLLGLRRYFNSETRGDMYKFTCGLDMVASKSFRFLPSIQFMDIRPEAVMYHWRSELFIGVADFQKEELQNERVIISSIRLQVEYSKNSYRLSYRFNQYIPLYNKMRSESTPPPGPSQTGTSKAKAREYGGGIHSLKLQYLFDI